MAALKAHDAKTPEGKRQIIDELAPIYGQMTHAVELDYYTNKLAAALEVSVSVVKSDLQRFKQGKRKGLSPSSNLPSANKKIAQQSAQKPEKETRKSRLEQYALFLLTNVDQSTMQTKAEKLKHLHFAVNGAKQLIRQMLEVPSPFIFPEFVKSVAEDTQTLVADV